MRKKTVSVTLLELLFISDIVGFKTDWMEIKFKIVRKISFK